MFSHIYFDNVEDVWILESLSKSDRRVLHSHDMLPFGTHEWERSECGGKMLTFSRCKDDEFTCQDGDCISLRLVQSLYAKPSWQKSTFKHCSKKCNSKFDCDDKSDEMNCNFIDLGKTYLKEIVPGGRTSDRQMEVNVSAVILAVVHIDTINLDFTVDYLLTLEWYDERLEYRDIHEDHLMNSVSADNKDGIWTPSIMFFNALGMSGHGR